MPRRQQKFQFEPYRNSALLSSHWLESRLCLEPAWNESRTDAEAALATLIAVWKRQQSRVERYANEAALEQAFIQPVFQLLGWKLHYQTSLQGRSRPDYALFLNDADYDAALAQDHGSPNFWDHVAVVADAKAWEVSLDRPGRHNGQREFPPQQIERYMDQSRKDFGILSNGRLWRLYPRIRESHQPRFETYFEFNLPQFLRELQSRPIPPPELVDDFLYFYLLFGPAGFRERLDGKALIVRALEGSSAYRIGIGEDLRARAFEAVRLATEGFLAFPENGLGADDVELCRRESFVLVYRLLFIMFAEDRGLLPFGINRLYTENRSLRRYRDDIATMFDRADEAHPYTKMQHTVLDDLRLLFDLVNTGQARYGVPPYNGGLFDPDSHPFLEDKQISDWHLARAIDQLGRAKDPSLRSGDLFRVDYRDLAIQHLGSIYEGLLELEPRTAATRMVVVAKRGRDRIEERTIPVSHPTPDGYDRTDIEYEVGQVYLQTSKGERRASGSYYTPDHIVNHIVEKTLGPLCQRVSEQLQSEIDRASDADAAQLRTEFDDRLLNLRVVDPAMGSGHFLLRACTYLAEEIATHPLTADEAVEQAGTAETALVYWKRRVAENCLYGVDLNDLAVELAKLAMWLETVAVDQPLTFLSHHLRHGNSLIGAKLDELGALPDAPSLYTALFKTTYADKMPLLLQPLAEMMNLPSVEVEQVKQKERLLAALDRIRQPFRDAADVWASTFVLPEADRVLPDDYRELIEEIGKPRRFSALLEKFTLALAAAHQPAMRPFHWEIEFPEVFFDASGRRERAGFDAVIGNPPYDVISELESGHDLSALRAVVARDPIYRPSRVGKNNLYKLFVCRGLDLLAEDGYLGFITPMPILGDEQAAGIRRGILASGTFTHVAAFPQKDDPKNRVFPEAKLSTAVVILYKTKSKRALAEKFLCNIHPGRLLTEIAASLRINGEQLSLYDPDNLTVVSCDQADFDIATRIMRSGRMRRMVEVARSFQGEVNETIQSRKGTLSHIDDGGPLVLRGANVCLYVVRAASQGTQLFLKDQEFRERNSRSEKLAHISQPRAGFQRSAPQNNFRRLIATMIAPGNPCFDTVSYTPQSESSVPLPLVVGAMNSKLLEWYFRLGSTNSKVNEYQWNSLPFPRFADGPTTVPARIVATIRRNLNAGDMSAALASIQPYTESPPFDFGIAELIGYAVDRITAIETARGEIARSDRSALAPEAQPYQDFLDRLFYLLAGLTDDEAAGLEQRLSQML